ncbi:MAG: FADH(2)-oxidizing methylenetetrahydrofolate--tRNA-(uracil(54)-C(5))-methyltransferase TrmFO [Selenomonadales bacterium]|nr:FADH(2)-oxidizing methylenetetrahydrofolate--tRNA-(uracil(54)-C(5))-methyltransferase TrmFO [Selenomonadales bacterium]MBQ2114738.1 FADH(2)-oxidizing methylenetetrahydrofolate--tRNA-(uracil(54)-C(5))-methyltransferase TrmFO [Selenomonadales bacterium]MBQ5587931.1 FADH(2)-oxidizing methylenetetrahydrofolate--tRNA-(uracil(54)-C(5))-methyltransferase TrmFO [Selenomonadales bacterium]
MEKVVVIGAGLAGSEAAWQLANQGVQVTLYEMRPKQKSPAHHTDHFAELVCSNSLRGAGLENAVGLLKEEMRRLGSLIMEAADACAVPAGGALAVDREAFGQYITNKVKTHPNIEVIENTEITELNFDEITIVATGPLTSGKLAEEIASLTGENYCYFYDAAAPIVTGESLDWNKVYRASRYGKGDADYVNCPFNEEEYKAFWEALTTAEEAPTKDFEKQIFFEGCMPIEVMAKRGIDTMRYGPMKPVGLDHPETGAKAYAVVQLRQDNAAATLYNIVGFQTHLKWPEQQRVFRMIPGLENAEFVRLGVMHRNTYIHSPKVLCETLQLKGRPRLFFAGQITGVEGYVESAASGLMAGINAARLARGEEPLIFPEDTAHGALSHYITHAEGKNFQPMNVNFGLLPPLGQKIRDKKVKNKMIADRALESLEKFKVFRQ